MREITDVLRSMQRFVAEVTPDFEVALLAEGGTFRRPFALVGLASPTQFPSGAKHTAEHIQPLALSFYMPVDVEQSAEWHLMQALGLEASFARAIRYTGGGRIAIPQDFAVSANPTDGAVPAGDHHYAVSGLARKGSTAALGLTTIRVPSGGSGVHLFWPPMMGARSYQVWRDDQLIANVMPSGDSFEDYVDAGSVTPNPTAAPPDVGTDIVGAPNRIPLWDYAGLPLTTTARMRGLSDFMRVTDLSIGRRVEEQDERKITVTVDIRVTWAHAAEWPNDDSTLMAIGARTTDVA
jgi:hypothetical protein